MKIDQEGLKNINFPKFLALLTVALLIFSCSLPSDNDNIYFPNWKEAVFIMNADGSNKTRIIDTESVSSVQFIPDSSKLLINRLNEEISGSRLYIFDLLDSSETLISSNIDAAKVEMTISNDGQKIVFWGLDSTQHPYYDLYLYNLNTDILTNLTNTPNKGEKEASYINYQTEQFILYSCMFDSLDVSYKSIEIYRLNDDSIMTLYCEETSSFYGYSWPIYDELNDVLYLQSDNGLYSISPLISGEAEYVDECYNEKMVIDSQAEILIYLSDYVKYYDFELNETFQIVECDYFDYNNSTIIYTYSMNDVEDEIHSININNSNQQLLTRNGAIPEFSQKGNQIVFFGQYEIE